MKVSGKTINNMVKEFGSIMLIKEKKRENIKMEFALMLNLEELTLLNFL